MCLHSKRNAVSFLACGILVVAILVLISSAWCQQPSSPRPNPKPGVPKSAKCLFLRHEVDRVTREGQEFVAGAPLASVRNAEDLATAGGTLADWATYVAATEVFAAKRTVLSLEAAACERNISLTNPLRLTEIDTRRANHVRRVTQRWQQLAGESGKEFGANIGSQVSAVYEAEIKSFYNNEAERFEDRDVGKDYPDLATLIRNSELDQNTKDFYDHAVRFLRYEEAGQLANALKGIDKEHGLDYPYMLRKALADRVALAKEKRDQLARAQTKERNTKMTRYAVESLAVLIVLAVLWIWSDRMRAKYRAFRTGAKRSPFWYGNAEWVFWEPGETVVLLQHKHLVPMTDREGGYRTISAWKGQEYKGRISYKTQFSTWTSDPILTSDGLAINLGLGIWWRIADAGTYVSKIASDYHEEDRHHNENLSEAAEFWIKKLAAGTLREEVNQLPAEKLISPYVQAYLRVRRGSEGELIPQGSALPNFSEQLDKAQYKLNQKTQPYGIEIERLEVQELILPRIYQDKLEAVRVAFLEPIQASAMTDAQVIALQGLASVIGPDKVGLIEILKHIDLSHVGMNPFTGTVPVVQPIFNTLERQTEKTLTAAQSYGGSVSLPPAPPTDDKAK
jgi:hypothetical protein